VLGHFWIIRLTQMTMKLILINLNSKSNSASRQTNSKNGCSKAQTGSLPSNLKQRTSTATTNVLPLQTSPNQSSSFPNLHDQSSIKQTSMKISQDIFRTCRTGSLPSTPCVSRSSFRRTHLNSQLYRKNSFANACKQRLC